MELDELLECLNDLTGLASSEGFGTLALQLALVGVRVAANQDVFGVRGAPGPDAHALVTRIIREEIPN